MAQNGLIIPIFANTDNFNKSMQNLSKKTEAIGKKLTTSLTLPIVGAGVGAAKLAIDYEKSLAKLSTIADTSKKSMDVISKEIIDLSNKTGIASAELTNNVYDAISAGQKTEDAVKFVEQSAKLAKAGFADSAQSLDILTTIMNSYGLASEEASRVSDILINTQNKGKVTVAELSASMGKVIPTANSMGVNLEQIASGYAIMTAKGIKAAETTTYMNSMLNEMGKSGTKANEAIKSAFKGKSFQKLIEEGKSVGDILAGMEEYAKKNKLSLNDMFGSAEAGKAALILAANGGDDFNAMLKDMGDTAGATDEAFSKVSDTTAEKFTKALNKAKNAFMKLGNIILPYISKFLDVITVLVDKFDTLGEGPKKFIVAVAGIIAAIGPAMILFSKLITLPAKISAVFSTIGTVIGAVFSPIGLIVMGVVAVIYSFKLAIEKNLFGLGDKFDAIKEKVTAFGEKFKKIFGEAKKIGNDKGLAAGLAHFISQFTGWDASSIEKNLTDIWAAFKWTMNAIFTTVTYVFVSVYNTIKTALSIITGIFKVFSAVFSGDWEALGTALLGLWETVKTGVINAFNNLITWLDETFSGLGTKMVQYGIDLIQGLINGVSSMITTAIETVKRVGSSILEGIRGVLGIASPSKVMRQYGVWTGEGLAIGINQSGKMVEKSTNSLGETVKRAGEGAFDTFDNINARLVDMSDMKLNSTVSSTRLMRYKEFNIGAKKEEAVIENVITLDGRVLTSELSPKFNVESGSKIKIDSRRMGVK